MADGVVDDGLVMERLGQGFGPSSTPVNVRTGVVNLFSINPFPERK